MGSRLSFYTCAATEVKAGCGLGSQAPAVEGENRRDSVAGIWEWENL